MWTFFQLISSSRQCPKKVELHNLLFLNALQGVCSKRKFAPSIRRVVIGFISKGCAWHGQASLQCTKITYMQIILSPCLVGACTGLLSALESPYKPNTFGKIFCKCSYKNYLTTPYSCLTAHLKTLYKPFTNSLRFQLQLSTKRSLKASNFTNAAV